MQITAFAVIGPWKSVNGKDYFAERV